MIRGKRQDVKEARHRTSRRQDVKRQDVKEGGGRRQNVKEAGRQG
jgi:hypothetical protein